MSSVVLDASALLAMLKGEPGGDKVAAVIAEAQLGVFNLAEVVSHFVRLGMPIAEVEAMLHPLPMTIVPADAALAWEAGRLRDVTAEAGLSLGDRFCLVLARRETAPGWTSDKAWTSIAEAAGVEIMCIR